MDANLSLKGSAAPLLLRLKFHRRLWQQRFDFAILEVSGKKPTKDWLVVSTPLKNMHVKLDHSPRDPVENKKYLKPPPRRNHEKMREKWTKDRSNTRDYRCVVFFRKTEYVSRMPVRTYQANLNGAL